MKKSLLNIKFNIFIILHLILREKEIYNKRWFTFLEVKHLMIKFSVKNLQKWPLSLRSHILSIIPIYSFLLLKGSSMKWKLGLEINSTTISSFLCI